jgi:hypothetical protein
VYRYDIHRLFREHHSGLTSEQKIQQGGVFFIALNSQYNAQTSTNSNNVSVVSEWDVFQQIADINKNRFYYYYCINIRDYVFQKKEGKDKLLYLELPKYVCLKTYIPNFRSFERLLEEVDAVVLSQRCASLKQYKQLTAEVVSALNSWECSLETPFISQKLDNVSCLVLELHETLVAGDIPHKVLLHPSKREFELAYPECPVAAVEALSAVQDVFESIGLEEVLMAFFCLLNEISLVVVGSNQRHISSVM